MAQQKKTVFQRLDRIFGADGYKTTKTLTNRYTLGNQELLKTKSQDEYDTAKLQAQQNKYLGNLWRKVDGELYQQAIYYETNRIGSYSDFESMEFYPEISAALDIMMEEATTPNNHGKILNIYSNNKRIKSILEDLFFNRLDLHTNLPMWTRNTCKYGDNFVFLNLDDKHGVVGTRQLPNFEIERREGNIYDLLSRGVLHNNNENENNNKVKFHWRGRDIEFNSWQIAHFRLLGDDRKLPYGTSILEKARRIWKQLLLSEDAMLVYRVTRAPERRVYKIFVGNIDDQDVGPYVNEIANRFKRTPIIDPQTGQIDLRYNQLAYEQDFFIPVRDENAQNPIDTLPGAQNLDQIADIEYLQKKLFTALRVPKTFLGFEEAVGEGKNLALQDIRFSRTINRIQQAMLMELNKIAIIHLYMLGFHDDLDNFSLTLNNPSTQAEMLKVEHLQQKISAYIEAVRDSGNGFGAMSMTRAKREILGMTDDEIRQDLLEQRMEKAAAAELENTAKVIKHTGLFDKVDKIYGDMEAAMKGGATEDGNEGDNGDAGGGGGSGGGFGGGGFSEEDLDFGEEGEDLGDEGTDLADEAENAFGDENNADTNSSNEGDNTKTESLKKLKQINKLLTEEKNKLAKTLAHRSKRYQNIYTNKLINSVLPEDKIIKENTKIWDKNLKINKGIDEMIKGIDEMLNDEEI